MIDLTKHRNYRKYLRETKKNLIGRAARCLYIKNGKARRIADYEREIHSKIKEELVLIIIDHEVFPN